MHICVIGLSLPPQTILCIWTNRVLGFLQFVNSAARIALPHNIDSPHLTFIMSFSCYLATLVGVSFSTECCTLHILCVFHSMPTYILWFFFYTKKPFICPSKHRVLWVLWYVDSAICAFYHNKATYHIMFTKPLKFYLVTLPSHSIDGAVYIVQVYCMSLCNGHHMCHGTAMASPNHALCLSKHRFLGHM